VVPSSNYNQLATKAVSAVTVATTATLLAPANGDRVSIAIINNGGVTLYVGGSGVTAATGVPIPAGAALADSDSTDAYYGIVASGTVDARVLEATQV